LAAVYSAKVTTCHALVRYELPTSLIAELAYGLVCRDDPPGS